MWRRTVLASVAVCVVGGAALCIGTDGFRALTSERARRVSIARNPRVVPDAMLEDQNGRVFSLAQLRGAPVAVEFIYTRCQSLCALLSAGMRQFNADPSLADLSLVSISFDVDGDSTPRLQEYAGHYGADGGRWRIARVRDPRELPKLLGAFGVVVIPDGAGGFQHNAAVHLLDAEGRLARVLDADASPSDLRRASEGTWR